MKINYFLAGVFVTLGCLSFQAKAQVLIDGINYDTISINKVKVAQVVALPKDGDNDVRYSQASITVPASVELYGTTYPVKKIGNNSMRNNNNLTSLTLPEGLEIIGNSCLAQCESLPSLVLPSTVRSIEDWAFYGNYALASINIPDGVPAITEHTFQQCKALTAVQLPASVTSLKVCAFQDCDKLASINLENIREIIAWSLYGTAITSATVTDVPSIGGEAFRHCPNLTTVALNNVGVIDGWAFEGNTNLTSVTLSGTSVINQGAFSGCSGLTSIRIPNTVNFIDDWAFEKTAITKIYTSWTKTQITDVTQEGYVAIGANAFGAGDGKINFSWYVPTDIYWDWQLDDYKGYPIVEDVDSAVKDADMESLNAYYSAGVLNLKNMDGYSVSVIAVDGRLVSGFIVEGNNNRISMNLNQGVYLLRATKGADNGSVKFIVR